MTRKRQPRRIPASCTGMTVVVYDSDDASDGVVIWDGEAESLGLPHAKTWPRVTSVDPAPPDDEPLDPAFLPDA